MKSMGKKTITDVLILAMLVTMVIKCVYTVLGRNYLYADGANFCYAILRNASGVNAFAGRQGSFFLMELPITIALKFGVTNIHVLCALFGIGSVIWFALFIWLAMLLARKYEKDQFVAGIAVLYALIDIYTGFFTQIESITAVGIFTYLLIYYLIARKNKDWFFRIIALALLLLLHNANEYFVGYSIVLALVLVSRFIRERKEIYIAEWMIHLLFVVRSIYTSYIAATQGAKTDSLMRSIRSLPEKREYWILIALVVASIAVAVLYSVFHKIWLRVVLVAMEVITCVWIYHAVLSNPCWLAHFSFSMRFMNLIIPIGVGLVCWIFYLFRIDIKRTISVLAIVFLIINSVYIIKSSEGYREYLKNINVSCSEKVGFFTIEETNFNRDFLWGWSLPMESILAQCLEGNKEIKSNCILQFNADYWEPFESDNIDEYADFSRYGIALNKECFK